MEKTLLFVPATKPERFEKALLSGADAVIVDLEDAVAIEDKVRARTALADYLQQASGNSVYVRVNSTQTEWFVEDMQMCAAAPAHTIRGILLPKTQTPTDIFAVQRYMPSVSILALIETAAAFADIIGLAATPGIQRLCFGTVDFRLEMGLEGDREALLYFRSQLVLASKLAGLLPPVDGVSVSIHDAEQISADAAYAKMLGFSGKLCIHPAQVATVQSVFLPSAEQIRWAEAVLERARTSEGSFSFEGKMIDAPVLAQARHILASRP